MNKNTTNSTVYDASFHARIRERSQLAARTVLPILIEAGIPFESVTDVGGGTGNWSLAARELGAKTVTLIDGEYVDPATLAIPQDCFVARNLTQRFSTSERADLAICVEVAEHLPPTRAASFVEDLCAISDNVLFSAALPFQGGDGHVNEMWPEYWASLFESQGYDAYDFIRPALWTDSQVDWWYRQNLLFFKARPKDAQTPGKIGNHLRCPPGEPLTRIHPEGYVWLAYRSRPEGFRTSAQRVIKLQSDISSLGTPAQLGYGGEFDSVPRPELMDLDSACLRAVIVGPGRTGSTALADALSDHPGLFCLNESQDLPLLQARFGTASVPARALIDSFLEVRFTPTQVIAEANARRAGKSPTHLRAFLDRIVSTEPELTVARFARYMAAYYRASAQASILIDKTPDYAHHLEELLTLWPDLRIILMVREAAPTALSMRNHHGYRTLAALGETSWAELLATSPGLPTATTEAPETLAPYLDIWSARVADALGVAKRLDPTQFTLLRYEELCAAPRAEGRRILRFLGADPDQGWLERVAETFAARQAHDSDHTQAAEMAAASHQGVRVLNAQLGYK